MFAALDRAALLTAGAYGIGQLRLVPGAADDGGGSLADPGYGYVPLLAAGAALLLLFAATRLGVALLRSLLREPGSAAWGGPPPAAAGARPSAAVPPGALARHLAGRAPPLPAI